MAKYSALEDDEHGDTSSSGGAKKSNAKSKSTAGGGGGGEYQQSTIMQLLQYGTMIAVAGAVGYSIFTVYELFTQEKPPPAPAAPPNPPRAPLRTSGDPCCVYPNAASNCHDWLCAPGGSGYGTGGNGKCASWDKHNDYHTFGTHGSLYHEGEEYRAYLDTIWFEYNASRFNTTLNVKERFIQVNGTYVSWQLGDDWKYKERCCPPTRRGSSTIGHEECHDLPEHGTCSEANQPGAFPDTGNPDEEFVTGMFCGHTPINQGIPDPGLAASLYNPLDAIRDQAGNTLSNGGRPGPLDYNISVLEQNPAKSKWRRKELAATYDYSRPSYWGQLQPAVRGSRHKEDAHIKFTGELINKGLIRKVTKVLLPGEPCCEADAGGWACHDWYVPLPTHNTMCPVPNVSMCLLTILCRFSSRRKCGPGGNGVDPFQVGWPTQGGWTNGKCGNWGGNDPALFPRSDGSPNYMYNERCCPWTQAGFSTPGGWCHDLPEGATCTQENQCASFPAQRSNGAINEAGTNDLHINGLHCSETPILHNTGRHAGNVYAQYNRTWAATREPGNDNFDDRLVDRVAIVAQYEDTEPGDWDPSNLLRKCTKSLMPGEPCCDANGNNCQDFRCGAPGAHWGLGWFGLSDPRNGKCSWWDGGRDPFRFPNADGSPNYRYKQRCCPWTERGSQTGGDWCHDLPFGASCTEANQCEDGLLCGWNYTCHRPLPAGSPCCNPSDGTGCHDL